VRVEGFGELKTMKGKRHEMSQSWPNLRMEILANTTKIPTITDTRVEIRSSDLPNTKQGCYQLYHSNCCFVTEILVEVVDLTSLSTGVRRKAQ
jgi:hypothetical protein